MDTSLSELIGLWRQVGFSKPPYILHGDEALLEDESRFYSYKTFQEFIGNRNFGLAKDNRFHLGLVPTPCAGNLRKASIYILALNPGFEPVDYYAESENPEFRRAKIRSLRQENDGDEFPFISLDPCFAWHSGASYWTGKFRDLINALRAKGKLDYTGALKILSQKIAILEHVPYHSRSYRLSQRVLEKMQSPKAIRHYVRDVLVPRAKAGDAVIIVTRKNSHWKLDRHRNIVVYAGTESRAAHLTLKSRGGKAIAHFLGL
jgi:hypothetical protein